MTAVQQIALDRALAMLNAAGVRYAVQMPDGQIAGSLPVGKAPKTDRRRVNNFMEAYPGYVEQVKAMAPGAVLRWPVTADMAEPFRKAVSSTASHYLGAGKCISTINDGHVELLRVE